MLMVEKERQLVKREALPISPEIIREYGIRALVNERIIEDFENEQLIRRTIERKRIEFREDY